MKRIGILLLLLAAIPVYAQIGARWDLGSPGMNGVTTVSGSGLPVLLAVPNVQLNWCAYPANAVPCTNYAPTYTSITLLTQCPSSTPIVLQQSSTCGGTSDTYGNLGAYTPVGTYSYTLTSNGVSSGPYTVTVGAVNGNFVDVTSNQTIAGNKTLTGATLAADRPAAPISETMRVSCAVSKLSWLSWRFSWFKSRPVARRSRSPNTRRSFLFSRAREAAMAETPGSKTHRECWFSSVD